LKRLIRQADIDVEELELQYLNLQSDLDDDDEEEQLYELKDQVNNDKKTFFIQPGNLLVEYDDNQYDTTPRPGIPGYWQASERWIYQ
jgi:hypothetical protein